MHRYTFALTLAALLVFPAIQGQAAGFELGAQPVRLALTLKLEVEGTFQINPDENDNPIKEPSFESYTEVVDADDNILRSTFVAATKVVKVRYGNTEILRALNEAELLDGTIRGWEIVAVPDGGGLDGGYAFVARKNDEEVPVPLTLTKTRFATAQSVTDTTVFQYDAEGFQTSSTASGSGTYSYDGIVAMELSGLSGTATGTISENLSDFRWYPDPDPDNKSYQEKLVVSKGAKITGLIGGVDGGSVMGNVLIGPGKANVIPD